MPRIWVLFKVTKKNVSKLLINYLLRKANVLQRLPRQTITSIIAVRPSRSIFHTIVLIPCAGALHLVATGVGRRRPTDQQPAQSREYDAFHVCLPCTSPRVLPKRCVCDGDCSQVQIFRPSARGCGVISGSVQRQKVKPRKT